MPPDCIEPGSWGRTVTKRMASVSVQYFEPLVVTDEMVERAASALALHEDYDPNTVPSQLWPAITRKYQERARVVLAAALGQERRDD